MRDTSRAVDRRTVLRSTAVAGLVGVAGCTGLGEDGSDEVVLPPPDGYDPDVAAATVHPTYGEAVPELTAPDPIRDVTVTTTDFVGERHTLYTYVFTRCPSACPGLVGNLRHVQDDSVESSYADDVALLSVTFDPAHDTADVLEAYEDDHGVDRNANNWYSLRPETPADAQTVVEGGFGVAFEETESNDHDEDNYEGDGENGHDEDDHDHEDDMAFAHTNLVLFVNAGGYVERAYQGEVPTPADVLEDVQTVVEGW
ncbi:SCO family protein [Salinadaptatus halalkaliphilus]|uniref:SCO family protein n=1 Tax=Salinadaptatus halalkaliphilus TaxID=2419781 RepID=A0A4S3TQH6_9EURY|nr:SCO family protein [Salinadaptatus halalkaliphilus]THE66536.1 SCO family protein [Salinadaptatus halalkaliphilus]